ncbi:hypothetical protein S40285_08666 [Stachybotrys chlorohalonatus IBT 40285]|uniref:Uncharacterized protein n=1 Tax=Stachybotrys chlorohalonatus (strain IBT 40285) TaxID=1283841 RepID=A0A084R0D6_STAC4|nr:hypothetical protein S40285_08666 [Stachybotrys chlorohalonata IBT 40285]
MSPKRPPLYEEAGSSRSVLKRLRAPDDGSLAHHEVRYQAYTIAWICALPLELAASRAMLDEEHEELTRYDGDDNSYVLGRIHRHNVVMVSLPENGTNAAAIVAANLRRSFPNISATLMVGIGGGSPTQANIYLGDVVVGTKVIQYDKGKMIMDGQFLETADAKAPAMLLKSAVANLQSRHGQHHYSSQAITLVRSRLPSRDRPNQPDRLFEATYEHISDVANGVRSDETNCDKCDPKRLQHRDNRHPEGPRIHYGVIASGNSVMKNGGKRDYLAQRHSALCFEMEAAGIMDNFPCLPIRGICDYSDSHKNEQWQNYAAATAAAYARELLEVLAPKQQEVLAPKHRRTTFSLKSTIKWLGENKYQIWERPPWTYRRIGFVIGLLVLIGTVVGTCVYFLPGNSNTRHNQDTILPQLLSSADLDGQIFLLARGHDGQLLFTTREEGTWTLKWNRTEQQTQSQPTSIIWGNPKRLSVFYIRHDNMVMTSMLHNGAWGDWEALGAQVSSPAVLCHETRNDIIHVWAREDTESKLIRHNYWRPDLDHWHTLSSDWESGINEGVATGSCGAPAVVCRNSTTTNDVVIYDKDLSSPLHKQWNTTRHRWGPWQALDGTYVGDPVLVTPTDDRVDFFGISESNQSLIHISWTLNSGYAGPYDLEGSWQSVPSVAVTASHRLDVFILSKNGTVNHRALLGSTWNSGWSDLGISATSAPLATRLNTTPPVIMLQVIGTGGIVLSSEWEAIDDGGLMNVVPTMQIGDGLSNDWMIMD